jgi:hypothetical protein
MANNTPTYVPIEYEQKEYTPVEYDPTKYAVNYDDKRFTKITDEKNAAITEQEQTYGGMIAGADKFYNDLKESTQKWADTQTDIQNQQTNLTIQQIEQEKANARKDYEKEQAGAYVDWRKQSNQYGSEAEKMASAGLANTGYSESSQVSMYNTYQNRVATARESFQRSCDNFANKIAEAKMQNNAAIAEIALTAFEKQAEYSLQAFQYKNQLILDLQDKKLEVKKFYSDLWQRELDQFNVETGRQFTHDQQQNDFAYKNWQAQNEREWKEVHDTNMKNLEHYNNILYLDAETEDKKELITAEKTAANAKLAEEYRLKTELANTEHANAVALATHKADLENKSKTFSTGSSGGSSGGGSSTGTSNKTTTKKSNSVTIPSDYAGIVRFAKSNGISLANAMTRDEWSRRRNSYSMTGKGAREVTQFPSYEAYLKSYVTYRMSTK